MNSELESFINLLKDFSPFGEKETNDYNKLLKFFNENKFNAFNNDNYNDGHITGSAIVLDKNARKMLLIHHKKLNRWLQPGGHSDGSVDIIGTAKRELLEETGIKNVTNENKIFDIDIHVFPVIEGKNPQHFHYDVRILFFGDSTENNSLNIKETNKIQWVELREIREYVDKSEEGFKRVIEKLNQL